MTMACSTSCELLTPNQLITTLPCKSHANCHFRKAVGRSCLGSSPKVTLLPVLPSSLACCSPLRPRPARKTRLSRTRRPRRTLKSMPPTPRLLSPRRSPPRHPSRPSKRRSTRPRHPNSHPLPLPPPHAPPAPRRSSSTSSPPSRARASAPVAVGAPLTAGVVPRAARAARPGRSERAILSPVTCQRRPRPRWSPNGFDGSDSL